MKKIYLAEDQPLQRDLLGKILETEGGYDFMFFGDGLKLYQQVQKEPPDLVIVDILLPSLSGLAVAGLLKFHEDYRQIRTLIISSITEDDIAQQAREAGADAFLAKPFEVGEFLGQVRGLLANAER